MAKHVADLWPVNYSLIVLELASSAHRCGDSETYQTAILILAELAGFKCFLASMQRPTSFNVLIDFLQDGKSLTLTLKGICTCLAVATTGCNLCVEFAEMKAYALGSGLLQLWCEYRADTHFRWQVENLMFILMDKSFRAAASHTLPFGQRKTFELHGEGHGALQVDIVPWVVPKT